MDTKYREKQYAEKPNPHARIGFVIFYPFQYFVYKNVYKHIAKEAEFLVDLGTFFPREQPKDLIEDIVRLLKQKDVNFRILWREDYYITPYLEDFFSKYEVLVSTWIRGCMKIPEADHLRKVHMTYGAGKELTTFGLWKKDFDLILAYGEFDHQFYSSITNSVIIGNPKFDDWFSGQFDENLLSLLRPRLDASKKTILYLPTHSDLCSIQDLAGTLKRVACHYNIIAKLHYYTPREEPELVELLRDKRITLLVDDADLLTLLSISHVVLSDNSSAIFDAVLANKPIIVTDFQDETYFDTEHKNTRYYRRGATRALTYSGSIEQKIKKDGTVCVIKDPRELANAVVTALKDSHGYQEKRRALSKKLFFYTDNQSGKRGADAILHLLNNEYSLRKPFLYHAVENLLSGISPQFLSLTNGSRSQAISKTSDPDVSGLPRKWWVVVFDLRRESLNHRLVSLRSVIAAVRRFGNVDGVRVLTLGEAEAPEFTQLISEYGEILSVQKIDKTIGQSVFEVLKYFKDGYVCFTTTDCVVPDDWLLSFSGAYIRYPEIVGVGGYLRKEIDNRTKYDAYEMVKLKQQLGIWKDTSFRNNLYEVKNSSVLQNPAGSLCNMAYQIEFLLSNSLNWSVLSNIEQVESFIRFKALSSGEVLFYPLAVTSQEHLDYRAFKRKYFLAGVNRFLLADNYPYFTRQFKWGMSNFVSQSIVFFFDRRKSISSLTLVLSLSFLYTTFGYVYAFLATRFHPDYQRSYGKTQNKRGS